MYARVVLGATKSVPFREVSSIQGCPYRGVPLYTYNITGKEVCSECDDPGWCDTARTAVNVMLGHSVWGWELQLYIV